jgi:hypothetical protein
MALSCVLAARSPPPPPTFISAPVRFVADEEIASIVARLEALRVDAEGFLRDDEDGIAPRGEEGRDVADRLVTRHFRKGERVDALAAPLADLVRPA